MRMLGAMMLANGLVGGPDAMLFWKESGRRIEAEKERDAAQAAPAAAEKARDAAQERESAVEKARDDALQTLETQGQELRELQTQVEQLQNGPTQRRVRRRLNDNGR